jgi:NADPH:quinone reductase-like Zn-dependent oxidoreductase
VVGVASREFFDQQPDTMAELWAQLLKLRRTGALPDPPVQPFPFADARGALEAIAGRQATGKVVLSRQA